MDTTIASKPRPTAREIGTAGMMMQYADPQIIAEQIAALRTLGLLEIAMPSIAYHNPVLAAALKAGQEHFIDYSRMRTEPREYSYEGSNGEFFTGTTTTWVAHLHYELQTVALFELLTLLETGELQSEQVAPFSVALGDTSLRQNAFLAFNYNPDRQPYEIFDGLKARLQAEGFGREEKRYDLFYRIPSFLWAGLDQLQRERFAAQLISMDFQERGESFEDRVLRRNFGKLLSSIFGWHRDLNAPAAAEGKPQLISFDFGDRFAEGHFEFTEEGILWIESLRGLSSARQPR